LSNTTPGRAIRKYCKECVETASNVKTCCGDNLLDGTVCPFFNFRLGTGRPSVKTIRKFCLECMGGSWQLVEDCLSEKTCPLFAYRMGKNPASKAAWDRQTPEEKERRIGLLKKNSKKDSL